MKQRISILVALLFSLALLTGCGSFSFTTKPRNTAPPPAVTQADDPRPVEDILVENARLRARQTELENTHREWQAAVDREERTKKDLKKQRDRAEDDLKQAKKRAKKS